MSRLYWSVSSLPSTEEIPALMHRLADAFPADASRRYLDALITPRTPPGVAVARLGALSLLPSLLVQGGMDPASVILQRDERGRPHGYSLTEGATSFDFNVSHSSGFGLCALLMGTGRVGVDVEESIPTQRALPLIRRYCTEGERRLLEPLSDNEKAQAFTRIWTIREAVGKQMGTGMPLRYDATVLPDGLHMMTGFFLDTSACLSLCFPLEAAWEEISQGHDHIPILWDGASICRS